MRLITQNFYGTMNPINEVVRCKRFTREKLINLIYENIRQTALKIPNPCLPPIVPAVYHGAASRFACTN